MYCNLNSGIFNSSIGVYPNPAKNVLNLSIVPAFNSESGSMQSVNSISNTAAATTNTVYNITIVNNTGSVIKSTTTTQQDWHTDVSGLMPGTYFIRVINNNDKTLIGKSSFVKL
jgi:hypothetical protein